VAAKNSSAGCFQSLHALGVQLFPLPCFARTGFVFDKPRVWIFSLASARYLHSGITRAFVFFVFRALCRPQVMERNGAIIGCAACYAYFEDYTAEVYAFAVHPAFRGSGRGDRLLESLELAARQRIPGIRNMFLLTTRTMDWFAQRGYESVGPAHLRYFPLL
jgi:GNAT superfamily N-acetyltransferase